jgi:prolyl-tRNA synthetase
MIGGTGSHELVVPSELGECVVVRCPACGYAANQEVARASRTVRDDVDGGAGPAELVATPNVKTIDDLVAFFGLPAAAFLKTLIYQAGGNLVAAVIPGDREVNDVKLANLLGVPAVELASDAALLQAGLTRGYLSPVGLTGITALIDETVESRGYIVGANQPDYHLRNVVPGRDFPVERRADLALVGVGFSCPSCGEALSEWRGLEVGHTFKLGTKYSGALGATYLGSDGREAPIVMGCYGIGLDRLLSAIVDANHDERGIIWPAAVAPYQVQLVGLNLDNPAVAETAEQVYASLIHAGREVLYDDRSDSPGAKFADADLIGLPIRLTVSQRSLRQGAVERTIRKNRESTLVPLADLAGVI